MAVFYRDQLDDRQRAPTIRGGLDLPLNAMGTASPSRPYSELPPRPGVDVQVRFGGVPEIPDRANLRACKHLISFLPHDRIAGR